MTQFGSHIKIDRYHRSNLKFCDFETLPEISGYLVWGGSVPSGISDSNPDAAGVLLDIDSVNNTVSGTEIWRRELTNFVHRLDGQKIIRPSFEAFSERCFLRGRSSGGSDGSNTVGNGLIEIDPETGDYIGTPFNLPGGGAFVDEFEIAKGGKLYHSKSNSQGVDVRDMDYNLTNEYTGAISGYNGVGFGVNAKGDIVMTGRSQALLQYFSKDKGISFTLTPSDISSNASQIIDVRCNNTHLLIQDSDDVLFYYSIEDRSVTWSVGVSDIASIGFDFNGDILVGRNPTSEGRVRKINSNDGSTIWESGVSKSLTSSASITQVGNLSTQFLYAWAGVVGRLYLMRNDGTVLEGSVSIGRGNIGIHPYNNDRILNYEME